MADKTISVSLDFTANTSQAEVSLKNLQASLASISNLSNLTPEQPISKELLEASDAAIVLRTSLKNAFDVNTGKLDLSKFSTSLAGANTDVKKIGQSLMAIGPEGQAAFRDLTNAVLGSSTPLQQTNALVGKLWDSLKRTAGWQLSSTMIHGFMGAIQSAYGYAQDLNKSLNNIRIVTGASTDEMAKFAEQANKAAKGLSTTTTEYTDAALIYYQQGIRDQEEIEGRVATTIKLANVSGQSAEEVSSQMTAIWNNFDDGSHSLEYYADVITALGAATASSSQEISQGLSKFAAVADTVGMSYEYATSALATIVATTRQSADTVGTGLRTLFSRLQGLKLGETLEDGVDLNKYSKALEAVGVKALDASGELRNMDDILNDLGERWGTLSKAQQVALAQTVGGVRQYTNLVALMDNWDFMKENVGIAEGAEGTLQEQADIYAESWEAAQKKVRAAAESIYSDLLDDKFFIGLTNAFAGLLEHLDKFIDGIGGLGTLLPGLIVLMNKMFGPQIQENIAKVSYNIAGMFTKVKNAREAQDTAIKNQVITAYKDINMSNIQDKSSVEGQVLARSYERIAELQSELVTNGSTMTQQQKDIKNLEISRLESLMKINAEKGKSIDLARKEAVELAQQGMQGFSKNTKRIAGFKDSTKTWETDADKTMTMQQKIDSVSPTIAASLKTAMTEAQAIFGDSIVNMSMKVTEFHDLLRDALNISPETQEMAEKFVSVADSIGYIEQKLNNFQTKAKESDIPINIKTDKQAENVIKSIEKELDQLKGKLKDGGDAGKLAAGLTASLDKIKNKGEITEEEIQKLIKQIQELRTETNKELELKIDTTDLDEAERKVAEEQNQNREQAENRGYQAGAERANVEDQPEVPEIPAPDVSGYEQFAATLQNVANYAMQAQMAMSGFNTALDAVTDFINGDATFGEALMRFLGGIAAMAPIVITLVQSLGHSAAAAGAEAAVGGAAAGTGGVAAAGGITAIGAAINTALPWLAAIGLALGLIIALFKKFHKTQDEIDAEKLETQKKATEDLGKAYEEAKNKAQELNDTISKFKDNEDALNKLTKGSQEFSKALAENRELAKELISTCNLDAMDWYYDDKGVFHLTASGEAKVEKAQKQNEEDTKKAAVAESLGKYQAQQMTNTHLLNEAGGNDRVGYGTASEDKNTWSEVYGQMRAVGEDNLKDLDAFNQLVNEAKATSLEGLQEYINSLTDSEKAANARAISYFEGLQKSGLNDSTKNYIATNGIQGDEWNTYKSVTQVSRENRQNMNTATSDFLANAAELNPEVARMMRSAQQYDVDITKNIGPAITKAIEDGQAKANNLTDTAAKQQYAERMGYSVSADGKLMNGDQEVDVDMDQIRAALAESFAAESPAFAASLESAIKEPLQTSMTNLFNEASTGTIVKKNGFDETSFNQAAGAVDDWTDPTEIQTFIDTLKLLGMSIPEEQLQAFIQKMQELTGATEDASSGVDSEKQKAYEDMQAAEANLTNVKSERREAEWVSPDAEVQAHVADNNSENLVAAAEQLQEAKQAYQEVLDQELNEEISALELDQEAIGETTDYLMENAEALDDVSDSLKDNKTAAKEVAKELARYGRAVEDVGKNYEDWKKVLKDKDLNKMPGVMKELSKSYGDLLDLDGSLLSDQFLQNSENLDLMNQAINGVDGAYEELLNRAQDDMLQLKVDPNSQAELYNELNTLSDNIRDSIKDVEVGAELNDEGFLQSLTDLVNAAGMTADEATEYLSSMGIDAEVVENKSELEGTDKTNSIRADIVDKGNITVPVVASDGSVDERQVPVQGVNYSLISDTADNKKEVGAPSLKVTSAKKSSGGGFKRSHGGGGGGGKGGGGGGGGGGSKKTKETPKADRSTRYHSVNRRQSNNSRRQTENNRKKDRAFGKAQVELAREDLEIQKKKIQLQEEYTKEISKNLKEDREEMKKQFADLKLPINFKFDEDGEISNYQEIIDALFEKEKALVNQYNSGGLDDEAFDEAKKKLDEAKEALGNYEETLEKQKDELQTLSEYMEELSDKALELTQIKFELNMSVIEDQLEWLDYSLEKLEDDAYGAAKAIGLMGQQTAQYLKQSEIAQNAINEILGRHGIDSIEQLNGLTDSQIEALGFNKDEIEALKDYRSKLYESNQALLEMRRTITDRVIDTFDTFNEKVQESYEEFDKYNDILEKYNDIVDLLGIKTDSATKRLIKTLRETQLQNLRNQSTSAKEIYEGAVANYDLAKKQYEDAVTRYGATSIQAQQAEEIMKNAQEAMEEGYSNWLDAYQAALEKANEIYEEAMEEIAKDFEASLTNIYGTFDLFDAAYERAKELKDDYLPEYEKIYELNKLNRDIQKEIDNSSSLRDKKALRQLQDEINRKQEAGVQLSKYEVEEMRKKFELEQARMNLEDARNNKSEVRLTRDQNGNWGYVYTAAEDKVADAEQKYEDALYNYQKLSDDYINELDEKIKDLTRNTQERLNEVSEALKDGLITADQAALQRQEILNTFYTQQNYLISQFKGATDSLSSSLGLMNDLYGRQAELVDTFPETVFGQVSGAGSLEEWANKSTSVVIKYAEEGAQAYSALQETNQKIAEENKMALSDIETATNNIAKASEVAQEKVTNAVKALTDNFGSALGALQTWDETYGKTIADAIGKNDLFIDSLNNVISKLATIASYEMKDLYDYIDYLSAKGAKGETITEAEWKKLDEIRQKYAANYSKESMAPFDTGGYTGEWGDEGKIAILHEKEYVLNADLTARFFDALKTFSLVDQFVNTENQIQQQQLQIETLEALSNYIDQLADRMNTTTINPNDFSASLFNSGNQQLEQNVHIEASFPNVTQSSEIEMAFDNLVNKASQYINRKNMSSMTFQDSYLSPV